MSEEMDRIQKIMNPDFSTLFPHVGGGAFGASRIASIITQLQSRLVPNQDLRLERPSELNWVESPKIPMSKQTIAKLKLLAVQASHGERIISPMQIAAQILEDSLSQLTLKESQG
jgi:hypothetical protein